MDMFEAVKDFHKKFGIDYPGPPRMLPADIMEDRAKFLGEEFSEYYSEDPTDKKFFLRAVMSLVDFNASSVGSPPALDKRLDALVDMVYVILGTAVMHGFDFNEAFRRVHEANMKKVRVHVELADGNYKNGVSKPEGWTAPDLSDLVTS